MHVNQSDAKKVVDKIFELYEAHGDEDYIGEPVSQLEHMCQAAMIAESEGYDEEVILAAFFHDIGHLCEHIMPVESMDGYGVVDHEGLGARFLLENGFSEKIASLVRNHVQAKRYLTWKYPEYYAKLSDASKKTLEFQGGVMSDEEARAFEADKLFDMHIRLRFWDEQAKIENKPLPDLVKYKDMALRHLMSQEER